MAKVQTRRSVSLGSAVYAAAMAAARSHGITCSQWITELIRAEIPDLPTTLHLKIETGTYATRRMRAASQLRTPHPVRPPREIPKPHALTAVEVSDVLVKPGTRCANCLDEPATHRGRIDKSGATYLLCDDCELPDGASA